MILDIKILTYLESQTGLNISLFEIDVKALDSGLKICFAFYTVPYCFRSHHAVFESNSLDISTELSVTEVRSHPNCRTATLLKRNCKLY